MPYLARLAALVLALGLLTGAGWAAPWEVVESKDAMTDKVSRHAFGYGPDGEVIAISKLGSGEVLLTLSIKDRAGFARRGSGLMVRVDQNPAHQYTADEVDAKGTRVSVPLRSENLQELLTGQSVIIRYATTRGQQDSTIPMQNAGRSISEALGIPLPAPVEN